MDWTDGIPENIKRAFVLRFTPSDSGAGRISPHAFWQSSIELKYATFKT